MVVLRAAAASAVLVGLTAAAMAQEAPSAEQLLERLGQIRGEVAGGAPREPAADLLPPDKIEQQIGERLGVQVLGVETVAAAGPPRYAVKVMNPPGNYNGALQVTTLLVDAVSGEILGEEGLVRPLLVPDSDAESGPVARRRTYR